MKKRPFTSPRGNNPKFPYSQCIIYGDLIFVSAQPPVDPKTDKPVGGDIQNQTRQVLNNVAGILEDAGTSLDNVLKVTAVLKDRSHFAGFNAAYAEFFADNPPARTTLYSDTGTNLVTIDFIAGME
ncbi:MAG: Rid family hydrolase [bacterium]|nr:Rid family hydrolase [bacterium]